MWRSGMTWTAGGNPNRFMPLSAPAALCSPIHWRWTRGMSCTLASGPELTTRGSWMLYFVMVFFSGLLALDAAFPLTLFRLRYCCDVRDPEPSDFYLITQRIGWVVCFVLILFGYIWALRSLP